MHSRKEFIEKASQMLKPYIGTRMAFWFDTNLVDFKSFNYHYGQEEGNILIGKLHMFFNSIPEVKLSSSRFTDGFAFLVITDAPRSDDEMVAIGNSYIYEFSETHKHDYPLYDLKISCGICPVFSDMPTTDIDNASTARKQSRFEKDSVTAVIFTEEMRDELERYRQKEREIFETMHEGRVVFDLQPKVNINTGEIVGAEALARHLSRDGQRIYPNEFMDVMEENGTVVDLDFMMLERACEFMADRIKKGLPVVCTSVNLSRRHLLNPSTADLLHAIVQRYDIPCELLEFELTETVFLAELADAKALTEQLHEYGYAASIDDFGSGYAGLNLCQEVDFDVIKLDRSFLTDDEKIKKKNSSIIPCIVDMMNRMEIKVVCEGAERADHLQFLRNAGCDVIQGYYFSKPLPPEEFYRIYEEQDGRYPIPGKQAASSCAVSKI